MQPGDLPAALSGLAAEGLLRHRRVVASAPGIHVRVGDREFLSFCSNDYLGLAGHPDLVDAACAGARTWGVGAGASHLITGHTAAHHDVEERLAEFVGTEAALLFSAGYMANLGAVAALVGREGEIFADRLNHASLNDAAVLSRAKFTRYRHCDFHALAAALSRSKARDKLVMTDAVFSMDGDIAPLPALLDLCDRHGAWLLVDDAHGFGVLGEGRGSLSHFGLASDRIVYVGTLGKAAGVFGAFVAGTRPLVDWLVQKARTYVYTTATPPLLAVAVARSLDLIRKDIWRRERLRNLVAGLKSRAAWPAWQLMASETPIQPLIIGDTHDAVRVSEALCEAGLMVPAIRPPTVPAGTARLRISLSAAHSDKDVARLCDVLDTVPDARR